MEMQNTENQAPVDYRGQIAERMKARYPDRNFGGEDGTEGTDSLDQAIIDAMTESESQINDLTEKQKRYDENAEKMTRLYNDSPRAMVFTQVLASTQNPALAIDRAYGKEAKDAFINGDASSLIEEIEAEDAKNRAEEEKFKEEKRNNLSESINTLEQFGNEHGLSMDQQVELFMRLQGILSDAFDGKYPRELFDMVWKSDNYDNDVSNARRDGEVTGRNARISEMTRRRSQVESLPPNLSGQGVSAMEKPRQKRQTEGEFWTE